MPDHVSTDETVIQFNGDTRWLHAAVDSDSNDLFHVCLLAMRTQMDAELFLTVLDRNTTSTTQRSSSTWNNHSRSPAIVTASKLARVMRLAQQYWTCPQ